MDSIVLKSPFTATCHWFDSWIVPATQSNTKLRKRHLGRGEEVDGERLALAVRERQVDELHVRPVRLDVGAGAHVLVRVHLERDECREVAARVTERDR